VTSTAPGATRARTTSNKGRRMAVMRVLRPPYQVATGYAQKPDHCPAASTPLSGLHAGGRQRADEGGRIAGAAETVGGVRVADRRPLDAGVGRRVAGRVPHTPTRFPVHRPPAVSFTGTASRRLSRDLLGIRTRRGESLNCSKGRVSRPGGSTRPGRSCPLARSSGSLVVFRTRRPPAIPSFVPHAA
jgi:hypothetical protein